MSAHARGAVRARPRGYTLIEVMAVVAILAVLMTILLYGLLTAKAKAYKAGTEATLHSIQLAMNEYYATFREYPPDGYDAPVVRAPPTGGSGPIKGSQCLVYYLGFPMTVQIEVGQDQRVQEVGPFLVLTTEMLSGSTDLDLDQKLAQPNVELIDKWGNPFHYDNVSVKDSSGNYMAKEQSDSHIDSNGMTQAPDPRKSGVNGSQGATSGTGIGRNKGTYDLWSHGASIADPTDDITNWK